MKLALTMEKFTFWGNDTNDLANSIKELLFKEHFVKLRMTTSTTLSDDLYMLNNMARKWNVQMQIDYEIDESYSNKPARVVVSLNPHYDYDGKSKSESDE